VTEIDAEVLVFLAVRHRKIGHHANEHLVQREAPGLEDGQPFQRQPAEAVYLPELGDAAGDVRRTEHRREGEKGGRQRGFDAGVPGTGGRLGLLRRLGWPLR
jgi:hypothetical protein